MKLDVGGGRNPAEGYKVLDIVDGPHVDYVCPAWDTPIQDGVVQELRARHFFEHLSPEEARQTLQEWRRILAPKGTIIVTVPDLLYHAKQLTMGGMSEFLPEHTNFDHAINSIFGWRDHGEHMGHQWGYTMLTLTDAFVRAGFAVERQQSRECDICIRARKASWK